ncbi:LysR family transcriptional regulator, partial [Salmonella enterica subsp. enterica serovar Alachua]|nr:LysR family transcriptional regulator [Salmonella enterica subsp. enterica serovar Alachua]
ITILEELEDAEGAFAGIKPKGLLRIDVHGTLARHFLMPALPRFFKSYPEIEIYMSEGDRYVDLVREGIDCVLRAGVLHDSDMIARRIALLKEVTLASPIYLERHGKPSHPDELTDGHYMVGFHSTSTGSLLPLEFTVAGRVVELSLPAPMAVNAAESYVSAACLGLGLIQVPIYHVQKSLESGELVEVLGDFPPKPTPVSLLYRRERQLSPRVRIFMDWLHSEFKEAQSSDTNLAFVQS